MFVDLSATDLDTILHALTVAYNGAQDPAADELESRLKAQRDGQRPTEEAHMARLQRHLATYVELTTPTGGPQPDAQEAAKLTRDMQAAMVSTVETLLFTPLWKLIREWKAAQ